MSADDRVAAVEEALVTALLTGVRADLPGLRTPDLSALSTAVISGVITRAHRGVGTLLSTFSPVFDAWDAAHPDADIGAAFARSPFARRWRADTHATARLCLEDAFARFAESQVLVAQDVLIHCLLAAVARALVVDPDPLFVVPDAFCGEPGRWIAMGPDLTLYAAVHGALMTGPVTPLIASLLTGVPPKDASQVHAVPLDAVLKTRDALRDRRLLP